MFCNTVSYTYISFECTILYMKNLLCPLLFFVLLASAVHSMPVCSGSSGAIWASHQNGSRYDYFAPGEDVYLDGHNFRASTSYTYEVLDIDGGKVVVASGTVSTDAAGRLIRKKIWTIPAGDYQGHKYRVDLIYATCMRSGKPVKMSKKDSFYAGGVPIPEFPAPAGPVLALMVGFLLLGGRRWKRGGS